MHELEAAVARGGLVVVGGADAVEHDVKRLKEPP